MFAIRRISRHKLRWVSEISTSNVISKDDKSKPEKPNEDGTHKKGDLKKTSSDDLKEKLKNLLLEAKGINETSEPEKVKVVQSGRSKPLRQMKMTFDERLKKSATDVAEKLGGNVEETTSDLLKPFKKTQFVRPKPKPEESAPTKAAPKTEPISKNVYQKVSSILMEIDKVQKKEGPSIPGPKISLNFNKKEEDKVELKLWNELEEKELKFLVKHSPRNYFEELILWTEQGKLWHFPIDNDQGMEEEAKVDFTEHVFLEEHLEPWCPSAGPLRHFMDLVLVGLSKNPHLTVEEKKEHIYWYRDYFESKRKLLMELGAFAKVKDVKELPESSQQA